MARASASEARHRIGERKLWYHVIEVAPGVTTPGWFDLRPIVDRMPWPDVTGKRCLDVGPYDGFLTFELERRGAAEVVAADIGDPADWDWPAATRKLGSDALRELAGQDPGGGFEIASEVLGSSVKREVISVYDLTPERVGEFDVVVCGSLLLHLKDPIRALEAIRSVCRERFLSAEQISPALSLLSRKRAYAALMAGDRMQWSVPNVAGHQKMVRAAGFDIVQKGRPYAVPLGEGHPRKDTKGIRGLPGRTLTRMVTGGEGMAHVAVLAQPA